MKTGTLAHRDLFCRTFVETHLPYEPENLPWPALEGALLERLRSFPFWSYARTIEHRAGLMVTAFAETLSDPVIREAVALQGYEETRHGRLMQHVLERYAIDAPLLNVPPAPATKQDFVTFGFGECSDSFLGFGAIALARQKQMFPESLLSIFDQVLFEEARHVVFFINWFRYEEALAGRDTFGRRHIAAIREYVKAARGTVEGGRAGGVAPEMPKDGGAEFSEFMDGVTPVTFLEAALAENARMMNRLDRRLIKPGLLPTLARLALLGIRSLPPRQPVAAPAPAALASAPDRRNAA